MGHEARMKNSMKTFVAFAVCLVLHVPVTSAQEGGRQIRLDANTCKNIMPEYIRKRNNPLYAKAVAAKSSGHANDMQKERIREVEFLRDTVKYAMCKGIR
jgi:hypothetical protein